MNSAENRLRAALADRYRIERELGHGGMATVYLARDLRHDREVALKVMRPELVETLGAERFLREIQLVARLSHPHILPLFDSGRADQYLYYVMPNADGRSLRDRLTAERQLPVEDAVRIATEVAGALDYAHRHGIVHRDIKPENIMLQDGHALVADFGIGKALATAAGGTLTQMTQAGTSVGTPAYMSPEQASGEPLDGRSDLYSLGCVLYEMLVGEQPFTGATIQVMIAKRFSQTPADVSTLRDGVSRPLARAVRKAMARSPVDRYGSGAQFVTSLGEMESIKPAAPDKSLAVLPFANLSADPQNEYFGDGLAEEIINALAQVDGLKVIARTSAFSFKGKSQDVRQIAQTLGVSHVLEGSVRRSGDRVRVTAQLVAAADGAHVWSDRFDRAMTDVFAMQDEMAGAITTALKGRLGVASAGVRQYVPRIEAYESYLSGRAHLGQFTPAAWSRAKADFDRAIRADTSYAKPHAELGLGYFILGMHGMRPMREVAPFVRAEVTRALELDPADPQPRFVLGAITLVHDYQWDEAAAHFAASMSGTHVPAHARWIYASLYLAGLGRFEESTAEMARAAEQDPLNPTWHAIWALHLLRLRPEEAIEIARRSVDIDSTYFLTHHSVGEAAWELGRRDEAIAAWERARVLAPWFTVTSGFLAAAHRLAGHADRADALLATMGPTSRPFWGQVQYHLLMSELDAAADWYERMIEERDPFALLYTDGYHTAALRAHPRWGRLAELMKLPGRH